MAKRLRSISDIKETNWKEGFQALRYVPRFFKKVWEAAPALFVINLISRILNAASPIIILWVGKLIIDEVILQIDLVDKDLTQLWWYVGIELAVIVFSDLIGRVTNLTDGLIGDLYSNKSSVEIIDKTAEIELKDLEDPEFYDKLERARRQTNSRVTLLTNILSQLQDVITVVSLITALIVFEPWLIVLLVIAIIPSFINEIKFSQSSYSLARGWTVERRELDYLRYTGASDVTAKEIKLFGLTSFISNRFRELAHKYYLANKKLTISRTIWAAVFNVLGIAAYYGAYVLIILRVVNGFLTVGELTFLSGSFNRLRTRLQGMFFRFSKISESALYLKDYFDFLDIDVDKMEDIELLPIPNGINKGFTFENVSFRYPDTKKFVLQQLNFTLQAGEKLAFVGENGAGKTTLIKLILRFYEPSEGRILLDGIDIRRFAKADYQQQFGVIFQDFIKYNFTAGENIGVGNIEEFTNEERIAEAAELSLANEVIEGLEDGYATKMGKQFHGGVTLSGGQWQKVALGRAYMKDAKVVILDEPTSALDARAEYEAFQRFIGITEGKTAIIISHRFSTVRMADRILVLKHGSLLEIGTHEELLGNGNLYAELFKLQAEGYQ
jgi:ATP-binding cassette subfamily B protein